MAFVLFILEVKTPATGVLALVGIITFLAGLLILFNSPGTPSFARISISSAVAITVFTAAFFIFIITKAVKAQRQSPIVGLESMVGRGFSGRIYVFSIILIEISYLFLDHMCN